MYGSDFFMSFIVFVCVFFCAQQCNPGDLRALRKGMSLYHSESQLSSLPQRQDTMHVVSSQKEQNRTGELHKDWEGGTTTRLHTTVHRSELVTRV